MANLEDRLTHSDDVFPEDPEPEHPPKKAKVMAKTPQSRASKGQPVKKAALEKKKPRQKAPRKSKKEKALMNEWTIEMIEDQRLLLKVGVTQEECEDNEDN
ncbi:MAG: hypothetical protein L6R40_004829 [Gallowayella cf. fulva]|nr:MAG: hypothetical protein L6R40_004829 [Xanthomendoza cf. fulva]